VRIKGYTFGFNGKEKVDEAYGDANAYDFGARIYDPRIGRFLSVDPLSPRYAFMSPYCFAANDPIRCIDVNGEGPGKPIDGRYNGTGNVMIILVDSKDIKGWNSAAAKASTGKWDYIVSTDLESAKQMIDKTYGRDNRKISNMLVRSHSSTITDWSDPNNPRNVGTLYVPTGETKTADTYVEDKNGAWMVKPKTSSEMIEISDSDIRNYNANDNSEKNKEIGALKDILSYASDGAQITFSACSQGNSDYLWDAIATLTTSKVDIYANKSQTGTLDNGSIPGISMNMERGLSTGSQRGWAKYSYNNGQRTGREDTKSDMKISRQGNVQTHAK
jgi:RHS repeat-associated protein